MAFYPDYPIDFNYEVRLQTKNPISNLSLPQHAQIIAQNETFTDVTLSCNQTSRQMILYYRTRDMMVPQLIYAENPVTNTVACMASLVPTFSPIAPQEAMEVFEDEEPALLS